MSIRTPRHGARPAAMPHLEIDPDEETPVPADRRRASQKSADADDLEKSIRLLRWTIEEKIPHDLRNTTHARRVASLKRQLAEARAELARLTEEIQP